MFITESDFSSSYKDLNACERAKQKLGDILPLKLDSNMASLLSYVTFDGHLAADITNLFLSSKDKTFLSKFSSLLKRNYGLNGRM